MKVEIILLILSVSAAFGFKSGFDCPKFCKFDGFNPVCSTEGNTYDNECFLTCDWAYKACDGLCPCNSPSKDCNCKQEKDYVCTYDNETYDNECKANCDGKVKMCDGPCPCR